ncbi:sugar phosphate isomerase/epimerase [Neobacillus niacini]|uniref:sugar phosphate isomerase/epimerase family protein n=1 Tax=Neobacillus niacini TaxID=86668 RepID=UPI00285C220C|nr:sugar phosphate isomerase/epimerase family protein [Neobacillus niacini]MDR7076765.1 sugar phosphate isomerase/epimerase [Neobacillus niacini]
MIANIGIRAHDTGVPSIENVVNIIANKGLNSVQFALGKSLKDINSELGSLSPGFAQTIRRVFEKKDIQIAVLGCYFNMIHPDYNQRRKGMDRFKEHLRFARDFGCSIVGTETGNVQAEIVYTEENFAEKPFLEVVESVKELVEEAEKFGVIVGIEGGISHPVHTPGRMKRLLDLVPSNNLQVIYDPANFISLDNFYHQEAVIQEAFNLFGDRMVIVHAKDFIIEDEQIKIVPVGHGLLNYDFLFHLLKRKKPFINILMESTKEPYIDESLAFLIDKYESA